MTEYTYKIVEIVTIEEHLWKDRS